MCLCVGQMRIGLPNKCEYSSPWMTISLLLKVVFKTHIRRPMRNKII